MLDLLGMAAKTSSFRILPPTPVPFTLLKSTPLSLASFRTIGVTYESSSADGFGTNGGGVCGGVGTGRTDAGAGVVTTGAGFAGAEFAGAAGATTGASVLTQED